MVISTRATLLLFIGLVACRGPSTELVRGSESGLQALTSPQVRIAEIHYDNAGADAGEAVELSGPAGLDVTGWSVVLYNGNGGAVYSTRSLAGSFPTTCGERGVLVLDYATNGIQNGGTNEADGVALVDAVGQVVEFLSYEGTLVATDGPAAGFTSTDIGVREQGSEAVGQSLQRDASGAFREPATSSFGACNDAEVAPAQVVASIEITPNVSTLLTGKTQPLRALALDAAGQEVTNVSLTWASDVPSIATVSAAGLVTAVAPGTASIVATAPNGVSDSASVVVTKPADSPPLSAVRINELHYDNAGTDVGEAVEMEGPAGADLSGMSLVLYDGMGGTPYASFDLSGTLAATCGERGVTTVLLPANGLQNGAPDGLALVNAAGQVVELLSYEGTFTATAGAANGLASTDIGVSESSTSPVGQSLQRGANGVWGVGIASFDSCNGDVVPPTQVYSIAFTGRTPSDQPLPVGFQDQIFATLRESGKTVATTFTWSSETPEVAVVDERGVVTALAAGTAVLRATAADNLASATLTLTTRVAEPSTTARYDGNAEFGEPTDGDASDDILIRRREFVSSWNPHRGTPNWVSYNLDASAFGPEDRCDCFTFDPLLPSNLPRYTTADYTGAAAVAGYGIDRGHLTRSFDRTAGVADNAATFLFSNVVPQASDLNQGPWAAFETYLGDRARNDNKEVYIVTGVAGAKGTLKNEGKIVIPERTWKVAVILPRDHGLGDIRDYRDVEVLAVDMPNQPGVRNVPWQTYLTTVDAIEALSGYDLLALLADDVEAAVESDTQPPLARVIAPSTASEGSAITLSAVESVDPNGTIARYVWSFGDGTSAEGDLITHVFAQDGVYAVTVLVTDDDGLSASASASITVANVAPTVAAIAAETVQAGQTYVLQGTFDDPGADHFAVSVDFGDGTTAALAEATRSFALSHVYARAGAYTVRVSINDGLAESVTGTTVTVLARPKTLDDAVSLVQARLQSGAIGRLTATALLHSLQAAQRGVANGDIRLAKVLLRVTLAALDPLVAVHALRADDAAALREILNEVLVNT